jgi:hypothetical protein
VETTHCIRDAVTLTVTEKVPLSSLPEQNTAGYADYGRKWLKTFYRGYTDCSFTERTAQLATQGSRGPTIFAKAGNTIEILFINKLKKNYATMHSLGLPYTKSNEGSICPYNTRPDTAVHLPLGDRVPTAVGTGDRVVYKWIVNDHAGPQYGIPAKVWKVMPPSFSY